MAAPARPVFSLVTILFALAAPAAAVSILP
jgi:hypothetical protein